MVLNLKQDILRLLKEQAQKPAPKSPTDPATVSPVPTTSGSPAILADPATPGDPNAPAPDPNATTDPNTPADPNAPVDPSAPVDPNAPIDPNAPVDPDLDPNAPVDPNAPPVDASGGGSGGGMSGGGMGGGGSSMGGGGGGMGSSGGSSDGGDNSAPGGEEDGGEPEVEVPEGSPKISKDNPVGAVYDTALEVAKTTIDPQLILNSVKSSMQANFGDKMEDAWPLVQRLKDTENAVLGDVAQRLSLFINGTIQENIKKGKRTMTANKERPAHNFTITEAQLARIIKNTVKRLNEENMFDALKSQLDQERNDIESRMSGNEVKKMALEFFEKLCQKAGLDSETLTPEAKEYVNKELQTMVHSIQDVGAKLSHVSRVVNAAAEEGSKKPTEGKG